MPMTAATGTVRISPKDFFGLSSVDRVTTSITLGLSHRSYPPKASDPRSDWVASVAVPAFKAVAQSGTRIGRFCTIGTGSGLDALAAIELLDPPLVAITDLHEDVVRQAEYNVRQNLQSDDAFHLVAGVGDLLTPLVGKQLRFDLIYENLPNIPVGPTIDIGEGQASSTFVENRTEKIPAFAERYLVALHYLALRQSYPMLAPGGRVLSAVGGRIPLRHILQLAESTSYSGKILTYAWKKQSEAEEVVAGYAEWEKVGLGPFHFYPADVLEQGFSDISAHVAGERALAIEAALKSHEITATASLKFMQDGGVLGHTVAVLESTRK
jgi:hypothetical protein